MIPTTLLLSFFLSLVGAAIGVAAGAIVTLHILKEKISNLTERLIKVEEDYISEKACADCKTYQLARHNEILRRLEAVERGVKEASDMFKVCLENLIKTLRDDKLSLQTNKLMGV